MHQALYRKYRPATFDDVVGQEHITSILAWEVANNKVSHAYVFCGSAGTGKTSCAKILAKAVNCENPVNGSPCNRCFSCRQIDAGASVEVLEMDAASNTGVDYIREIREDVIFSPGETGTKVYIIDEVHMLSEGAFNALLKTLEEPPKSVLFILATTEMQDIPATILSRCQRFDFKRLSSDDICRRLSYIAKQESLDLEPEAALLIARLSQGGMRDAVSLFELCIDREGRVTEENVRSAAGIVGRKVLLETVDAIAKGQCDRLFAILAEIFHSSKDVAVFLSDLIGLYRDMLVQKVMKITSSDGLNREILDVSEQELSDITALSALFTRERLIYHIKLLEEALAAMSKSEIKRITAEITLLRLALGKTDSSIEGLESRIAELENRISEGGASPAAETAAPAETIASAAPSDSRSVSYGTASSFQQSAPVKLADTSDPDASLSPSSVRSGTSAAPNDASRTEGRFSEKSAPSPGPARPLTVWVDILDDYSVKDPSRAPFLKDSIAYLEDDARLVVFLRDSFSKMMLENAGAAEAILRLCARRSVRASDLEFRIAPHKTDSKDPLRELL